jgi:hypothetical protein
MPAEMTQTFDRADGASCRISPAGGSSANGCATLTASTLTRCRLAYTFSRTDVAYRPKRIPKVCWRTSGNISGKSGCLVAR